MGERSGGVKLRDRSITQGQPGLWAKNTWYPLRYQVAGIHHRTPTRGQDAHQGQDAHRRPPGATDAHQGPQTPTRGLCGPPGATEVQPRSRMCLPAVIGVLRVFATPAKKDLVGSPSREHVGWAWKDRSRGAAATQAPAVLFDIPRSLIPSAQRVASGFDQRQRAARRDDRTGYVRSIGSLCDIAAFSGLDDRHTMYPVGFTRCVTSA